MTTRALPLVVGAAAALLVHGLACTPGVAREAGASEPSAARGQEIFDAIGCAGCHVSTPRPGHASVAVPSSHFIAVRGDGPRAFFDDGGGRDLIDAIRTHRGLGPEASRSVERFQILSDAQKQDLLHFLRSR